MNGGHTPRMSEADRAAARDLSLRGVRPPAKVTGYEHEQFLGHGAYGEVWVAVNRNSGRKVAIKFFTRRGGLDWAALAREVEAARQRLAEITAPQKALYERLAPVVGRFCPGLAHVPYHVARYVGGA